MSKNIIGLLLVDAPHSALNCAGSEPSDRTENIVRVKSIRTSDGVLPYVSAQAFRYWWRATIAERFQWNMSPIIREKKVAFTEADPFQYPDDDIFGYMRAEKSETLTRISPLKCSPLVSVLKQRPIEDFGVMARHKDGDPVPFEHEFYSTVLKGIFSLDIDAVGNFLSVQKSGYKNLGNTGRYKDSAEKVGAAQADGVWKLPRELRLKRIQETISALPYLSGGAKLTLHLTDVSPKLVLLAVYDGGNQIFMNLVSEQNRTVHFSVDALREVMQEYEKELLTPVYIGRRSGFLDDLDDALKRFETSCNGKAKYATVNEAVGALCGALPSLIEV